MKNSSQLFLKVFFFAGVLGVFGWAMAQTPGTSDQMARVVTLDALITDKSGKAIEDVHQNEVQVFEDGKPQEIYFFSKETRPVKYAIAIDASLSLRTVFARELAACRVLIDGNSEKDQTALIRFISSDKITTALDFTSDKARLGFELKQLYQEGGQSAVIDGLYTAVQSVAPAGAPQFEGQQAVVLVSDGEDRRSLHKLEDLVKLLHESRVKVFVIAIVSELNKESGPGKQSSQERAAELLNRVAKESGGRAVFARDSSDLSDAAQAIAHDLRTQFVISYRVTEPHATGWHKIDVKMVGPRKLKAITRPGYVAQ